MSDDSGLWLLAAGPAGATALYWALYRYYRNTDKSHSFEHEPAINPKLLKMENVLLLPHMGSATIEGRIAMGEKVIINIKTFADGHTPPDRVLETMF